MWLLRFGVTCALIVSTAFAQSDRGTITGTVSDASNAVIVGAAVNAANVETGSSHSTVTTETGSFTLTSLPVGSYELSVEVFGFNRHVQQGIRVQVAQTLRIDVALQIGASTESITVVGAAPLLRTESAEQSTTIDRDSLNRLPINFAATQGGAIRHPLAFVTLSPGAYIQPGSQSTVRVNGSPNTSFKIMLEGQDATNGLTQSTTNHNGPSVEAMEEFTLQSSNFSAEYGQVVGGLINFTARSGTNQFHGSLYEYFVNEALNAGIPFTDNGSGGLFREKSRRHDFGGSIGGPVILPGYDGRNKTFFFFNVEAYYDRKIQSGGSGGGGGTNSGGLATVPTDAMRAGDFSAALTNRSLGTDLQGRPILENKIYDPLTSSTIDGRVFRDPYPNNTIPQADMDPVALRIQNLLPRATRPGLINNWDQIIPLPRTQLNKGVKVDHSLSDNARMSFYWMNYTSHEYSGADGLPIPITAVRDKYVYSHTFRLNFDQTVTPTFLLHAGVGEQRFHNPDSSPPETIEDYDAVQQLGLMGGAANGFPRLTGMSSSFGGMFNVGPTNVNKYYTDKPTAVLNATWIRGNHAFKFGGEWRIDSFTDRNQRQSSGVYDFDALETGLPATQGQSLSGGSIGLPYASFLLGRVNNASVNAPQDPQLRKQSYSGFVQDAWKITRRLTVDYGLRYDRQGQGTEIFYRQSNFGPDVPNPSAGGLLGAVAYEGYGAGRCDCKFSKTYNWGFGPRLGLAYQINDKTVFRAGWGITYGPTPSYNYITNQPLLGVGFNQFSWSPSSYGDPAVVLENGLIYDKADLYTVTLDPGVRPSPGQINSPPYWIDPGAGRPPRISQWSIGFQREITPNLVVEASYVGNRGVWHQANSLVNLNGLTPERIASVGLDVHNADDRRILTSRLNSSLAKDNGFGLPYADFPDTLTVAQSLRPYPQFGDIPARWSPVGNNWYDSLQVKTTKRYSRGLTMTVAFTWQKELSLGSDGGAVNNVFNRQLNKTISPQSMPLVLVTGFNYEIPRFGQNRALRAVLGDWSVGGILRYASGLPIPVPGAQNSLNSVLFQGTVANRVEGEPYFVKDLNCGCIDPNKDFVLNPNAWADPAQGEWGTAAPYLEDYRYARRYDEQLTIGRAFRIREGVSLNIRAEFFNVFNRTYLNNPTSNNALAAQRRNALGLPTAGFGRIDSGSVAAQPRNGQIVARLTF